MKTIAALLAMLMAAAVAQAQDCRREQAAVTSARAALQEARGELRNLEAELAQETSPAVRKNIEKQIKELRTRTIPDADRAVQAAESALAACTGAAPPCSEPEPPDTGPCSGASCVVDIKTSDPSERQRLKTALGREGTTVRLGPAVTLDFTGLPACFFPIRIAGGVTLTSVARFPVILGGVPNPFDIAEARSPSSLGPLLKYGPHRDGAETFLEIRCYPGGATPDHVRISGFRLYGPKMGQQHTREVGIKIIRCVDISVSNMEIAGWAEQGVKVADSKGGGGRINNPSQVVVSNSYLHHNQQPTSGLGGHAGGYGVETDVGATATIAHNVFDFNRHAIASDGESEGYVASHNLVLKGGGEHGGIVNPTTHAFDAHGTGANGLGGLAGKSFLFDGNAFQFRTDHAIKIRGEPGLAVFTKNVFPHSGLDDAIVLDTPRHSVFSPDNRVGVDTFGQYGVCDFDGDGVDDLFLATGQSWWFASAGEFHWSFLADATEMLKDVRLGYFDADARCDVLTEQFGQWVVWNGATRARTGIGAYGVPLAEVEVGRFDPNDRDHRQGATRQTTHAFRRAPDGQWFVTLLTGPDWRPAQSSSFPLNKLRFGDFTGDGVTDVLAVNGGRWSISDAARGSWRKLNDQLGDDVSTLFIANLDPDDNIDDLLKLDRKVFRTTNTNEFRAKLVWWRSKNGTEPWVQLKSYSYTFPYTGVSENVLPVYGFAGRFGAAPGGGTLIIDPFRRGQFFSPAEASPEWSSLFAY